MTIDPLSRDEILFLSRYLRIPASKVTFAHLERYDAEHDAIEAQPELDAELRDQEIMCSNHWGEE
jgi:hypothetical protein